MSHVIALHIADKTLPMDKSVETPISAKKSHVLKQLVENNQGRLDCGGEQDIQVPDLTIYAAR